MYLLLLFSSSVVCQSCVTPRTAAHQAYLEIAFPGASSNSCPLSQWYNQITSSYFIPFSGLQSFPASGSFLMSQLFTSGGPSIGVSASAWVFPMNIQGWFPSGLTGLISLQSKGLKSLLQHHRSKEINSLMLNLLYHPNFTSIPDFWKNHSFD